jgi:hypothetical protein
LQSLSFGRELKFNMAAESNMLTWAGGWGLPSLDPCCLQAMVC